MQFKINLMHIGLIWHEVTNTCKVIQELLLSLILILPCEEEVLPTHDSIIINHLIIAGLCCTLFITKMYNRALVFYLLVHLFLSRRTDFDCNSTC